MGLRLPDDGWMGWMCDDGYVGHCMMGDRIQWD